jgi:hypothetical protein
MEFYRGNYKAVLIVGHHHISSSASLAGRIPYA